MMSCVVPGCINRNIRWTAQVPKDHQVRASWRAAILGGTGRELSEHLLAGKRVCQVHFVADQQPSSGEMYREPTLFLRDMKWRKVACCQLCMRYDVVESMFNRKRCLGDNMALQSLAYKYFRVRQFVNIVEQESFFCTNCVVQIDIAHRFSEEINENSRNYERLMRKIAKTMVAFERNVSDDGTDGSGQEAQEMDEDEEECDMEAEEESDDAIEETAESKSSSPVEVFVKQETEVEGESVKANNSNTEDEPKRAEAEIDSEGQNSDCEVEEEKFEIIELDDDDNEPAMPKIKTEPGLETQPVRIKQEVPDDEPLPEPSSSIPVKVKEERPEDDSVEPPMAKKQRSDMRFGCLLCKSYYANQATLNIHMRKYHEKPAGDKGLAKNPNLPLQTVAPTVQSPKWPPILQSAKGPPIAGVTPRILNKQYMPSRNAPPRSDQVTILCGNCLQTFKTPMALEMHTKLISCKRPQHHCTQCHAVFNQEEELDGHVEVAHGTYRKVHKCEICHDQINSRVLFDLHQSLICRNTPQKVDKTHMRYCALVFFKQKKPPGQAFSFLSEKYGTNCNITRAHIDLWYSRFGEGNFVFIDESLAQLQVLINANPTISTLELAEHSGVEHDDIKQNVALLGQVQKYGRWVPQDLPPSIQKNRFNYCRALLARYKDNEGLENLIMCSERWINYGNAKDGSTEISKNKVLLCIWWDQKGLIFHELLEPHQAEAADRYQAQFSRFTKTMQSVRSRVPRHVIFQYGITDPTARQEMKKILGGIGWELLRHPVHSPDIDPTDYHLFRTMQYGFHNLYFSNPGQVYRWVAQLCKDQTPAFYLRGIRMLAERWQKVVDNKGDYCGH